MSTKFYTLLTDIGAAKLASAAALGVPLKITHMAVGDGGGTLPTPDAKQTALVNEKRRAALNMLYIDPQNSSQIIAEQVIPENEGGWWIREVGLFDESGALIAVGNCPESYKPQLAEGSGRTQTVRMVLITSSTDNITLKIDPAVVLSTRKYVDDKISEHEQSRRHPDASLTAKGFTQLSSATNSESEILAATPKAVKAVYDLANGKQPADATLTALAGLATAADKLPYFTGNDTASLTTLTNVGRNILDKASTQAVIQYLGLSDASGYVGRWLNTRVFTSSGTYTPTPGTKRIRVTITGGGGGGGGCKATSNNETFFGAGGGAGGTIISIMTPTQNSYPVTIGAGGAGGVSATNGTSGGNSVFASLIAPGGAGGGKVGVTNTNGGNGGVPSTGDIRITGGNGGDGQSGNIGVSGEGGTSHWGGGGRAGAGGGVSGKAYGSGGGGAYDAGYSGTSMTGGKGAAGICIIEEFA